jgi:hypothetical protein
VTISMYSTSVPVFERMLGNAMLWLDKAQAHAEARRFSPDAYLALRLAPDMLPFTSQLQIASDTAKGAVARLSGQEPPRWSDDEATLAQLRERLQRTIDYARSVPAERFEGAETREITIPRRSGEPLRFTGEAYLVGFVLPNLYFHLTTAYALLRHAGVELGKTDFLGRVG